MKIITGYTGTPHVNSDDMSALQQGIVGVDDYALYNGSDFTAVATTGSKVNLSKGEIVLQGTHIRVEGTEEVSVDAGTQGLYRYDLIIARYSKEAVTDLESCEIDIVKGTAAASNAAYPELQQNDIRNGGTVREVALFAVYLYGSVIQSITRVIPMVDSLYLLQQHLNESNRTLGELGEATKKNSAKLGTLGTNVANLQEKLDFPGTLRSISQYAKAAINSWVSSYDKSGKHDVLGTALWCQNASGSNLSSLRLYSNGRLTLYKGETGHAMWVVKKGYIKIKPSKANTNKQGKINFGVTFAEEPTVILTPHTEVPANVNVGVSDVGKSSCNANLTRNNTTETVIYWVAFGRL